MAQINEKPRKRQFLLELDEDEIAELITWADNPSDDFVRGDVGDALLRTLRAALSGPTRKSQGATPADIPKRSVIYSGAPDKQRGNRIDTGEGMTWTERD